MSPNEFQLREALHDGEGDLPDADLAIARALRVRYERRRRITTIASAAAVVAVVAGGGTLLARTGSGESAQSGGGAAANYPNLQATHGGIPQPSVAGNPAHTPQSARADANGSSVKAFGIACPAQLPRLLLPGGGGTGQFGADQPLFDGSVAAMKICAYDAGGAPVGSSVLNMADANATATRLDSGNSTRPACPTASGEGSLAVYAVTTAGTTLRVVTVELGCPFQATNGTAVRYLSSSIADAVRLSLSPARNVGSPVK